MINEEIDTLFGARVKLLRKQAGLTQAQLAEQIDKTTDTVSNIERGFSAPRLSTANAISKALNVEIAELFQFTPSPPGKRAHKDAVERFAKMLLEFDDASITTMLNLVEAAVDLHKKPKSKRPSHD